MRVSNAPQPIRKYAQITNITDQKIGDSYCTQRIIIRMPRNPLVGMKIATVY
jgi:hypothetical protein